jgi:hypothetical protein
MKYKITSYKYYTKTGSVPIKIIDNINIIFEADLTFLCGLINESTTCCTKRCNPLVVYIPGSKIHCFKNPFTINVYGENFNVYFTVEVLNV